jgi:two-component system, NtrC family, sensor histidine kinase PilS
LLGKGIETLFLDRLPDVAMVPVRGEVRAATPSGKQRTFGITKSMLRVPEEGVVGFIFTFNDLTEIRRLEREIRMRDRLAAVGRLAAGIAHEIRNPLTSIAGSAQMFATVPTLNEEQRTLADIIIRESERLNSIITDFLTYSREKSLKLERGDLIPLLEDTLLLLQNRPDTKVRIVRQYQAPQAYAVIDGDKLKQVFWNLCENAMRAMSGAGTLEVKVQNSGNHWWISFHDSGPGIDPQQMDKIFEPFQSGFSGGTGLGLAIVYQIVNAHDGKIAVRSEPNKGAEFIVQFKQASEPATSTQTNELSHRSTSPLRTPALLSAKGN